MSRRRHMHFDRGPGQVVRIPTEETPPPEAVLRAPMTIDVEGPVRCAVIVDSDGSIGVALDIDLVEIVGPSEVPGWRREATIILGIDVARAVVDLLERAVSHASRETIR